MKNAESPALRFLYGTLPGRAALKLLTAPALSRLCGRFLDSGASRPLISPFVRRHGIDLADYVREDYTSFNAFFSRQVKAGARPVAMDSSALIAPCDGLLSAYRILEDTVIPVKQSRYTVSSLLGGDPAAKKYQNGICLVFRLCVHHYHRYCYVDSGWKGSNVFLPGRLHTVRPIALEKLPVFVENCREYTVLQTENFGPVVQMEVGAMLVGKIRNYHGEKHVRRGEEKGMFPSRVCFIRDRQASKEKRVMLEMGKERKDFIKEKLVLFGDERKPTENYRALCKDFYLKF